MHCIVREGARCKGNKSAPPGCARRASAFRDKTTCMPWPACCCSQVGRSAGGRTHGTAIELSPLAPPFLLQALAQVGGDNFLAQGPGPLPGGPWAVLPPYSGQRVVGCPLVRFGRRAMDAALLRRFCPWPQLPAWRGWGPGWRRQACWTASSVMGVTVGSGKGGNAAANAASIARRANQTRGKHRLAVPSKRGELPTGPRGGVRGPQRKMFPPCSGQRLRKERR